MTLPSFLPLVLRSINCLGKDREVLHSCPKLAFHLDGDLTPWFAFQALKKCMEENPILNYIKPGVLMGRGRRDQTTGMQVCSVE